MLDCTKKFGRFSFAVTAAAMTIAAQRAQAALILPITSTDVPIFNTASVFNVSHAGNTYALEPGTQFVPGGFDVRDLFGGSFGTYGWEQNDVIFNNGQPAGTVNAVDVTLATPVSLTSFNLFLEDDGTSGNRSASEFKLFAGGQLVDAPIAQLITKELLQLRSQLAQALNQSSDAAANPTTDLPAPASLPSLDVSTLASTLQLHQPPLGFLGTGVQLHGIRKQLDEQLAEPLRHALLLHSQQLNEWRAHYLTQLRQSFTATADLRRQWPTEAEASKSNTLENEIATIRRDIENLERSANSESFTANQP